METPSAPDPEIAGLVAAGGIEFVVLELVKLQIAEEVRMHFFGTGADASEPETRGSVGLQGKEALDIGLRQDQIDGQEGKVRRLGGGVEAIEGGAPAAEKAFTIGLAFPLLDAMPHTISNQGAEYGIGVTPILAEGIGASPSRSAEVFGFAASALPLRPGKHAGFVGMPR